MSPGQPETIGPYQVHGVLGRGNMGIVYQGTHTNTHQRVAIKTVQAASSLQQSSIRREVHSLSRLAHPGVVSIVDSGTIEAVPWYAMVLLEGKTLEGYIRSIHGFGSDHRVVEPTVALTGLGSDASLPPAGLSTGTLPPGMDPDPESSAGWLPDEQEQGETASSGRYTARSLRIARRLMATLAHVHSFGVVHRDIKPANIFLVSGDEPVLVDFGLSHAGALGQSREIFEKTSPGAGTPAYMSPEVIRGRGIDARADIYSAGCVIFELFAGKPPFLAPKVKTILTHHLSTEAPRLDDLVPDAPPELADLIAKMLAKSPRHRLSYAFEAVEVLRALEVAGSSTSDEYTAPTTISQLYRPKLAGRASTLAELSADIKAVASGQGGFTAILGRSGIGKTYLAREAIRALPRDAAVVPGRCMHVGTPLHPFTDLFEHVADACAGSELTTRKVLGSSGPVLAPFNLRLASLPGNEGWAEPAVLEGGALRERLVSAVSDMIVAFAQLQPLVILVDDVQWADGLSLAVLQRLAGTALDAIPLRVVATCRSEDRRPAITSLLEVATVRELDSLDRAAVIEIIREMLATNAPPSALVEHLVSTADGSPFYVAEYLRTAHAVGSLGTEGAEGSDLPPTELPASLEALILRRLSTLDDASRAIVDLAAVMGRAVDEEVLAAACDLDKDAYYEGLYGLERLQIIETSSLGPLQLAHDKLVEAAYDSLDPAARAALHTRVANAIEAVYARDTSAHNAALAHHYEQGGDAAKALKYYRIDAEATFEKLAYEESAASLQKVLALGDSLAGRDRAHYAQMLGECYWSLGDIPRCEQYTLQAFADLGQRLPTSAPGWMLRIVREAAIQAWHLMGRGMGTVSDPVERENLRRMAVASNTLCWRYLFDDNIPYILALAISSANQVERAHPQLPVASAHGWLAFNCGALRLSGLAARYFARAHASAKESGDLPSAVFAILMEGLYDAGFGRFDHVTTGSSRALQMMEGQGDPQNEELHHTMIGLMAYFQGNFTENMTRFDRVHELATKRNNAQHTAWGLYAKCWGLLATGRFEEALPRLEAAKALLDANGDLASEIITYAQLASSRLHAKDLAGAREFVFESAQRIFKTKVANFPTAPGYGLATDVAIDLSRLMPDDKEVRTLARKLVRSTRFLTLLLPYATCISQRVRGRLKGPGPGGARLLKKSASTADSLGMRYEAAQAWFELAQVHATEVPEAPAEARRRLEELGCTWHLTQLA